MGFFSRLFKVAQSEAHSVVDRLEDPIKMTEQGIRDLRETLQEALTGLAQVKAVANRLKHDLDEQKAIASDYERKAVALLQRSQSGELAVADADRLAGEALTRKNEAVQRAASLEQDYTKQSAAADNLQRKVEQLRRDISRYQNELITLKARAKTATSMKKVNKELAGADASGTIAMLEKMKAKVLEEESLAQAYGEIGDIDTSIDDEIDKALDAPRDTSDDLAALKAKLGMGAS
ncbi:MAG: PspA/IM30 family protein [Deinococcota bacterium]